MSAVRANPYLPSCGEAPRIPFERYLPLYPPGVAQAWVNKNLPHGGWCLDPMGASPLLALEAAQSGCRVLVACNNPVTAFQLRLLANPPSREELTSTLNLLANQRMGGQRLEPSLQELYLTRCSTCGTQTQASGFVWRRDAPNPHARIYLCPNCSDTGEHLITDEDIELLQPIQRSARLHRARALEKVLRGRRASTDAIEETLDLYTPRALYALFTIMNNLERMELSPRQQQLMEAMLIYAMDDSSALWSWPEEQARPRQLTIPTQSIERNIWMSLEKSVDQWAIPLDPVILTTWPDLPDGAGVCLYPGRMKDLAKKTSRPPVDGIICLFPRISQAYWTLSALWASWLWEDETSNNLTNLGERQHFDWRWHTSALHAAVSPAATSVGKGTPVLGILAEPNAGLVSAVVESAYISGLHLSGIAVKDAEENIQMEWVTIDPNRESKTVNIQKTARDAMRESLQEIGEPSQYVKIHTAAMCALADRDAFPPSIHQLTYEKISEVQSIISALVADQTFLTRLDSTSQDLESGLWWLAQPETAQTPLSDRLELELQTWLQEETELEVSQLSNRVNQRFPGYLTPNDLIIHQCLDSYAILDTTGRYWKIKPGESGAERAADVLSVSQRLDEVAKRLGLRAEAGSPTLWRLGSGRKGLIYRLFVSSTAVIDRQLINIQNEDCETIFLVPGSRAGLMTFKLDHDPYLREKTISRCHFLKFRTLRAIASRTDLSLELWKVLIDSDPLSQDETTQLSMFS